MPLPVWRNRSPAAGPQEQLARLVAACRDDTAEQPAAEGCTAGVTPGALGEAVACVSRLRARVAALEHENAALRGGQKPPAAADGASAWGEVQEAKRRLVRSESKWARDLPEWIEYLELGRLVNESVSGVTRDIVSECQNNLSVLDQDLAKFHASREENKSQVEEFERLIAQKRHETDTLPKGRRKAVATEDLLDQYTQLMRLVSEVVCGKITRTQEYLIDLRASLEARRAAAREAIADGRDKCLRHARNLEVFVEKVSYYFDRDVLAAEAGVAKDANAMADRLGAAFRSLVERTEGFDQAKRRLLAVRQEAKRDLERKLAAMEECDPAAEALHSELKRVTLETEELAADVCQLEQLTDTAEQYLADFFDRMRSAGIPVRKGPGAMAPAACGTAPERARMLRKRGRDEEEDEDDETAYATAEEGDDDEGPVSLRLAGPAACGKRRRTDAGSVAGGGAGGTMATTKRAASWFFKFLTN
eukprot:gene21587-33209_t